MRGTNWFTLDLYHNRPAVVCDPMCGSGTFLIEAALMATNTAPGLIKYADTRSNQLPVPLYWKDIDRKHWQDALENAKSCDLRHKPAELAKLTKRLKFMGNDMDVGSLKLACQAAKEAKVDSLIAFSNQDILPFIENITKNEDFFNSSMTMITNPPWHKRLLVEGVDQGYSGSFPKHDNAWNKVITAMDMMTIASDLRPRKARWNMYLMSGNPTLTEMILQSHGIQVKKRKEFMVGDATIDWIAPP